jgi:hypothetical protein
MVLMLAGPAYAMTGSAWYETCNLWPNTSPEQEKTLSPEKKVAFRACRIEAVKVYCNFNYEGDSCQAGNAASDETSDGGQITLKNTVQIYLACHLVAIP